MPTPIVYATRKAIKDAEGLLQPGEVLENIVEALILRGAVCAGSKGGYVFHDESPRPWVASCRLIPPRVRMRGRAWLVVGVEANRRTVRPTPTGRS